jgi:hypothetical protein
MGPLQGARKQVIDSGRTHALARAGYGGVIREGFEGEATRIMVPP